MEEDGRLDKKRIKRKGRDEEKVDAKRRESCYTERQKKREKEGTMKMGVKRR